VPELPEVETIRRGLKKQIVSWKIKKIIIKKPNLVKQSMASFRRELIGGEVSKIDRIGKLLIFTVTQSQNCTERTQVNADKTKQTNTNSKLKHSNSNRDCFQSPDFRHFSQISPATCFVNPLIRRIKEISSTASRLKFEKNHQKLGLETVPNQNSQPKAGPPGVEKFKIQNYLLIHLKMTGQLVYCDKDSFVAGGHANSKKEEEEFLNIMKRKIALDKNPSSLNNISTEKPPNPRHFVSGLTPFTQGVSKFCQPGKYTHIIFDLEKQHRGLPASKEGKTSMLKARLFFNDLRQFGMLKVVGEKELKEIKSKYGIEPGRANFTLANFKKALQNRKTTIKALLLNQAVISGLGNIYVDESLFASKIHPQRRADSLTSNEQKRLFNAIKRIIKLAIENNGTTFSDFVDSKGERGNFKEKLKVYGRKGKPCLRKNCSGIIQKIKVAGRGTYFCPVCQKL